MTTTEKDLIHGISGRWELWRRLLLAIFILVGIWLIMYVDTQLISITAVDYAKQQKALHTDAFGTPLPEKQRLKELPLDKYITESTNGKLIAVVGGEETALFQSVFNSSAGHWDENGMSERISSDSKSRRTGELFVPVFFRPGELPLGFSAQNLTSNAQSLTLSLGSGIDRRYLRVDYHDFGDDLGPFGVISVKPPESMFHPYRRIDFVLLGVGILLYLTFPAPRKFPDAVFYPRWRMIMGDIASLLMLLPFFWLPMLINGGSLQAFTGWWGMTLFFWLFAATGVYLLWVNSWYSSYQLLLMPDALLRFTYRGREEFAFREMLSIQPLVYVPPRWLVVLSWIMVFVPSSNNLLAAANALRISNSDYLGLVVNLTQGRTLHIWYTDQLGSEMLPGLQRIVDTIKKAGIPEVPEPLKTSKFIFS